MEGVDTMNAMEALNKIATRQEVLMLTEIPVVESCETVWKRQDDGATEA